MTEYEFWYEFCMLCKYAYVLKGKANTVYCSVSRDYCPYKHVYDHKEEKKNER